MMPRILKALLLAVSAVGYTSGFSVFNPDTTVHLATATASIAHVYQHQLAEHPLVTKMMTGSVLAVCGDALAQSKEDNPEYDTRRAAGFAVFDSLYRALQHVSFPIIVAHCHGQTLGSIPFVGSHFDASSLAAMESTLASQLGIVPFLYYPAYFSITGAMQGLNAAESFTRAQEKFLPLMQRNLLFWIPVQYIQFGFIPEDLQIPFLSVCGLCWTFILSLVAGRATPSTPEEKIAKELEDIIVVTGIEEELSETATATPTNTTTAFSSNWR
jgi:hypothetical protein